MIRINEIVAMNKGTLAIIFTDDRSGQRDVTFFKEIATKEDISELEVYTPKPTDKVVTLTLEEDTLQRMQASNLHYLALFYFFDLKVSLIAFISAQTYCISLFCLSTSFFISSRSLST